MAKEKIIYSKDYTQEIEKAGVYKFRHQDKDDNINEFLKENYLVLSYNEDKSNYLAYLEKGIMKISSDKTPGMNYKRRLEIEIMPTDLTLPFDLEMILKKKKFKEVKDQ